MRQDLFEIVEYARTLLFCVKLKTNAVMIRESQGRAHRGAGRRVGADQHLLASAGGSRRHHQAARVASGAPSRASDAAQVERRAGQLRQRADAAQRRDYPEVQALAAELGVEYHVDPTITPMMDGDRSILDLNIDARRAGAGIPRIRTLVGNAEEFCAPPAGPLAQDDALDALPCSAGHTACYISPYGDVFPCVQFPLPSGNVRTDAFPGYLAALAAVEGSAVHHHGRSAGLLLLRARRQLLRAARGSRIWKATCADLPSRIARNRLRAPACRRRTCCASRLLRSGRICLPVAFLQRRYLETILSSGCRHGCSSSPRPLSAACNPTAAGTTPRIPS